MIQYFNIFNAFIEHNITILAGYRVVIYFVGSYD